MQNKNLGYNVKQIISVSTEGAESKEQIDGLMNQLKSQNFVKSIARAQAYPGGQASGRTLSKPEAPESNFAIQTNHASPEILETLGMKLLAGTTFPAKVSKTDTTVQVVVNQSAIKFYGYHPKKQSEKQLTVFLIGTMPLLLVLWKTSILKIFINPLELTHFTIATPKADLIFWYGLKVEILKKM